MGSRASDFVSAEGSEGSTYPPNHRSRAKGQF